MPTHNERWSTRAIILNKEFDALFVREIKNKKPVWNFPGGKHNAGETPWDCCRREIREETGLDLTADDFKYVGCKYGNHMYVLVFHTESLPEATATSRWSTGDVQECRWSFVT